MKHRMPESHLATLHVGDKVQITNGVESISGVIKKITKTRQICVDFGGDFPRRFNSSGIQIYESIYRERNWYIEKQ